MQRDEPLLARVVGGGHRGRAGAGLRRRGWKVGEGHVEPHGLPLSKGAINLRVHRVGRRHRRRHVREGWVAGAGAGRAASAAR